MKPATLQLQLALAAICTLLACSDYGAVAPEGARLSLTAGSDSLSAGQDSTLMAASIFLESGDLIGYEADVTFQTSFGGLCALRKGRADCPIDSLRGIPAITLHTVNGVAVAVLRGAGQDGTATVQASSGDARDTVVIKFAAGP